MENEIDKKKLKGALLTQTMLIGLLMVADQFFGFFEQNFFNTYLVHVLGLEAIYVSIMVSLSSVMGLIFFLIWGTKSDNTRSKWGRRRPYLIMGGVCSGIAMILYAFSPNFYWCLLWDVLIIGIFSNMYFAAERALIPDTVPPELRGRANGVISIFGNVGVLLALIVFLLSYELFAIPNPNGAGNILTQEGHFFVLALGGIFFIICGIVGFIFIKEIPVSEMPPKRKFTEEFKEFFDKEEMKKQKDFFKMVISYIIFKTGVVTVLTFLFIYLFWLGLTTMQLLLAIGIAFIILIFSTLIMGYLSDKYGRKKFVPLFIIIASFGFFLVPFSKPSEDAPINLLLFYIAIPFIIMGILGLPAPLDAWAQDLLPEDRRGKFLGIYNFMWVISQIIGSFLGGFIIMYFGYPWIFLVGGIIMIISIPFFLRVKETLTKTKKE